MKRLLPLAVLLAAPPLAAQDVSIPYTEFTLDNGLRVMVHEDHSTPLAAVSLYVHVGGIHEQQGKTGFAHLFEHLMFEGSTNVPEGQFDAVLTAAGADYNATTDFDRTWYYATLPSNALEQALWLDAERMGGLLDAMTQRKLDGQREVVKNERRQRIENQPYGRFFEQMYGSLYPAGTTYSWLPIGSMEDLARASTDDVSAFFRRYYVPNNAVLVVAGDVTPAQVREMVQRNFGWIPRGADVPRLDPQVPPVEATRYVTLEDRVSLPQVNVGWRTVRQFADDHWALDVLARLLAQGKSSRLYQRLVYRDQQAQAVIAFQNGLLHSGDFLVRVTGKADVDGAVLEAAVLEEVARLAGTPPTDEELQRVKNGIETELVAALQRVDAKADALNNYLYYAGRADFAAEDLRRTRTVTPADVQRVARQYLHGRNRVVLSIVPQGKTSLAAREGAR
jgi:zinc protease